MQDVFKNLNRKPLSTKITPENNQEPIRTINN